MSKSCYVVWILVCLVSITTTAHGDVAVQEAVTEAVANSNVFPPGTTVASVRVDGSAIQVDLSKDAVPAGFGDALADAMSHAIADAVAAWPEITGIEITAAGRPLWQYLPRASDLGPAPGVATFAAPKGPFLTATTELAGKLVVLHPSHGSYWFDTNGYWLRAMRTFCGPNPATSIPPGWTGSTYQPSDYYFWTRGYQWSSFYEDDMSPETIRFLAKYCESSGATVWVSRNLDKNAGNWPVPYDDPWTPEVEALYPNCSFLLPRWQTAAKYFLQDIGMPASVWNEPTLTKQSDKDIRARPYYANHRMAEMFPGDQSQQSVWGNCVSLSLHSNAAGSGNARGTETYWYTSIYTHLETEATRYATNINTGAVNAILNGYDGFWADAMYVAGTTPPEWPSGTYYGYQHAGGSTTRWQNRGVKNTNFGEIREAKMPAALCELAFHDDWKFYPDHVFLMDQIFRATVAWGFYEGICNQFYATPKPRLAATVVSTSFPTIVGPNQPVNGSVTMQNEGMAWCWGNKFLVATTQYMPYTVWKLKATVNDQFAAGTMIALAPDVVVYPGDNVTFNIALTSPAASGLYTTEWQMRKDDQRGGDFGDSASAQIRVDADGPMIAIASPEAAEYPGCVWVSFEASDEWSGVAGVDATIDGQSVSTDGYACGLQNGPHTLVVTATDGLGNTANQEVMFSIRLVPADLDVDGDVDQDDFDAFEACATGPGIAGPPVGCTTEQFDMANMDDDSDVDQSDFSIVQRCYGGENLPPDPGCAD